MNDLVKSLVTDARWIRTVGATPGTGHALAIARHLERARDAIEQLRAAHAEIIRKYEKIMGDPPDWTSFSGPDDPRLTFSREAWFGAAQIARRALAQNGETAENAKASENDK